MQAGIAQVLAWCVLESAKFEVKILLCCSLTKSFWFCLLTPQGPHFLISRDKNVTYFIGLVWEVAVIRAKMYCARLRARPWSSDFANANSYTPAILWLNSRLSASWLLPH